MKIQCPCGTKYSFEVTPEMVARPITFVCQQCGVDSSAVVNELIRQMYPTPAGAAPPPPTAAAPAAPKPTAAPARIGIARAHAPAPAIEAGSGEGAQPCVKHLGQMAVERCVVCQKPICPKCMEMFGYLCSAFCKGRAEQQRIYVPPFAGQKAVAEARYWRKSGLIFGGIILSIAVVVGALSAYQWYFSVPQVAFSVKLEDKAYSGTCRIVKDQQLVFLHGGLVARHDLKKKKEVWSRRLIDKEQNARAAEQKYKEMVEARKKAWSEGRSGSGMMPTVEELREEMLRSAEAGLSLHVSDGYLWVASPEKIVKYDWETGQPGKEVVLEEDRHYGTDKVGDELLLTTYEWGAGRKVARRINLQTGDVQDELPRVALAGVSGKPTNTTTGSRGPARGQTAAARPAQAGRGAAVQPAALAENKPLDPAGIAAAAQNLPLPSRIALPAVLAANANQQRLMAELRKDEERPKGAPPQKGPDFASRQIKDGPDSVEFSVALLEEKKIARQAMKAPPQKSVLDGDLRVTQTAEVANEILNEMQRNRTDGVEVEDVSRYAVQVRRGSAAWSGEVVGHPSFFPLKTMDVVAGSKQIVVLDKQARKLWESTLNFQIGGGTAGEFDEDDEPLLRYGEGPCVEKGNVLYIIDAGVLTAFDAASGNALWRLPSVGIAGILFDDAGMIYVNTTTASPEKLKYSQQIDIRDRTHEQVLKVDPATGKTLWSSLEGGLINYLSGKYIYSVTSHQGDDMEGSPLAGIPGVAVAPHVRIIRLNPKNGKVMWEHYQRRAPIDIQIDQNTIQILFRKEMQVLKFWSL